VQPRPGPPGVLRRQPGVWSAGAPVRVVHHRRTERLPRTVWCLAWKAGSPARGIAHPRGSAVSHRTCSNSAVSDRMWCIRSDGAPRAEQEVPRLRQPRPPQRSDPRRARKSPRPPRGNGGRDTRREGRWVEGSRNRPLRRAPVIWTATPGDQADPDGGRPFRKDARGPHAVTGDPVRAASRPPSRN